MEIECDAAQGYYFARPMWIGELEAWVAGFDEHRSLNRLVEPPPQIVRIA